MYNVSKVQDGLLGLVGIRQPYNPAYQKLDVANTASRSGLFLDDVQQFKVEYWIDTNDYKDITNADLNESMRNIQKAAISSVVNSVFGNESYIDRNFIYSHATNRVDVETGIPNGFVGFEIKPSGVKDVAFKITRVRLEFQSPCTVKLLLFNSNLVDPMQELDVSVTSKSQLQELNWVVNNSDGDYKGTYYFGYIKTDDIIPFKRNYENAIIENNLTHLDIERVKVSGVSGAELFDLSQVESIGENTGLNPDITVYSDYTDLILQNDFLFAEAIQMQWAILVMQNYINSPRSNRHERLSKEVLLLTMQALEGAPSDAPVNTVGLRLLLNNEIKRLKKTIEQIKRGYFGGRFQNVTIV